MGCGAGASAAPRNATDQQTSNDGAKASDAPPTVPPEAVLEKDSAALWGVDSSGTFSERLDRLLEKKPFLKQAHHFLNCYVVEMQNAVADERTEEDDQYAWDNLTQELAFEEKIISAAFKRFDNHRDHQLIGAEIQFMLDYLSFPSSPADVKKFEDLLDKNDDDAISFVEFVEGVGRLGGSAKLFELRRAQIQERHTEFKDSAHDEALLRHSLQECGIQPDAQHEWRPIASGSELDAAATLAPCQKEALRHIRAIAQMNHDKAFPDLQKRVIGLGYNAEDLWMCLAWIRELSPIIVHINLDKVGEVLSQDSHYRNQHETKTSSGLLKPTVRTKWEKQLFGPAYDKAEPFDRPKYGVQNVWNDYRGVMGCKQYGDSYIVLKDVRLRCTLSPQDSGNLKSDKLAVLDFYAHVLHSYSDKELLEVLRLTHKGAEKVGCSAAVIEQWGKYKEAQIHGAIDFNAHVDRLVVSERHREDPPACLKQLEEAGWKITWQEEMKEELQNRSEKRVMTAGHWEDTVAKLQGDDAPTKSDQA